MRNIRAFDFADPAPKANEYSLLAAYEIDGNALQYADAKLRNSREFVIKAEERIVKGKAASARHAAMKYCKNFIKSATENNGELKKNGKFLLKPSSTTKTL